MQDKGSVNAERSIVLSTDPESPIQNPVLISAVSSIFDKDVLLEDMGDDDEDDYEDDDEDDDGEENDDKKDDNDEKVLSASSHSSDNDDDDDQGGAGVTVTEASNEKDVDDYMNDDANEVSEDADGEGENVNDQNKREKLSIHIHWMKL
ncbi:putative acting on peptide bonds (peptidase) [Helianthus anomalus]